jgi:hypothetical protein
MTNRAAAKSMNPTVVNPQQLLHEILHLLGLAGKTPAQERPWMHRQLIKKHAVGRTIARQAVQH